jgi:NAD(P)H-dependent FMN reductase
VKVLALSGSLRAASINSAFCRAAIALAPRRCEARFQAGLGELPLFNPDLEASPPPAVAGFRAAVAGADALLIASPEYAHGVSGVMKNALDWLVSFEGAVGKPVALVNTSPRAQHAYDSLAEILRTMSLSLVADASLSIPLLGYCRTEAEILASPAFREAIGRIFTALAAYSR